MNSPAALFRIGRDEQFASSPGPTGADDIRRRAETSTALIAACQNIFRVNLSSAGRSIKLCSTVRHLSRAGAILIAATRDCPGVGSSDASGVWV